MIPNLDARGLLPPGIHVATWQDLAAWSTSTSQRLQLFENLMQFVQVELQAWGQGLTLDVGGSFLSDKAEPPDLDATLRIPLDRVAEFNHQLLAIGDMVAHVRIKDAYSLDFYVTIVGLGNDFSAYLQYVGEKTAAAKYLQPQDRRGIARITL